MMDRLYSILDYLQIESGTRGTEKCEVGQLLGCSSESSRLPSLRSPAGTPASSHISEEKKMRVVCNLAKAIWQTFN